MPATRCGLTTTTRMLGPRESRPSGLPDVPAALHLVGVVLRYLTLAFAVPLAVALWQGENPWPYVAGAAVSLVLGVALSTGTPPVSQMRPRDTFLALGLGWLLAAVAVSVPYLMTGLSNRPLHAAPEGCSPTALRSRSSASPVRDVCRTWPPYCSICDRISSGVLWRISTSSAVRPGSS